MTPIHEMKTRKATWEELEGEGFSTKCHGVFFEVGGREVGVVIRDQSEEVARPLIEAIAALPDLVGELRNRLRPEIAPCLCYLIDKDENKPCGNCAGRALLATFGGSP